MEGFKKTDRWTDEEVQALLSIYKTKDSAIAMLETMCEDTAVGEDSSPTDSLTHQVSVKALEGISEDGPSTSRNCAPLSTSTSNDEVNIPTSRISRAVPESSALLPRPGKRKRDRDHLFLDYLREFDEKNREATRAMFLEEVRLHKEDLELRRQERKEDQQLARELIEQNQRHDRDFQMGFLAVLNRFVDTMSQMPK
ncbi:uncharacterized protein LOC144006040 [Festucalex cinctus]